MQSTESFPAYKMPQLYVIAGIFGVVGLVLFWQSTGAGVGVGLMLFAVLILGYGRGYTVDLATGSYSQYRSMFGLKTLIDKNQLADLEYLSLVRIKTSQTMWVTSIQVNTSDIKCKLNFVKGRRNLIPIAVGDKEKLMGKALAIAESANLKIFDMTTHEKKWIEPQSKPKIEA